MATTLEISEGIRAVRRPLYHIGRRAAGGKTAVIFSVMLLSVCILLDTADAQSPIPQPAVDLGSTSFLDGEGGPGLALEIIGGGYQAWHLNDSAGNRVPGSNQQSIASFTLHPIYVSHVQVLGGNLGFDALIPVVHLRNDFAGSNTSISGVGDISVSPQIQWSNLQLWGRPFAMRVGLQFVAPTGSYKAARLANVGQNLWQVSPYYAFTWRTTDRWEVSGRLIYDWSGKNDSLPTALQARSAQPGDQLAFNLSASYAVSDQWRVGLAGYALQQLSDAKVDGASIYGSRQRVFGIGPGILWSNNHATVIANVYKEFGAKNRPEGYQAILRLITPF